MKWREIRVLYWRELCGSLREKTIVINSLLIPVFLFPFLLWAALTGILFVEGQTEGFVSRIAVQDWPKGHPGLRRNFEVNDQIQIVDSSDSSKAAQRIKNGGLDGLVEFLPAAGAGTNLANNFQARITYNESKERSATARKRAAEVVDEYRADWVKREAFRRGTDAAEWQGFLVSTRNVATDKQLGAFIMALMLPLLFVVMVAMGCFFPAIDATAGERERNTWETLMSTAASRRSIVTAKYLYVATMGGLAGTLNLIVAVLTMKPLLAPLLAKTGQSIEFFFPLSAVPIVLLAAVLLAGFVAAGMMIFASFARTFKEGQAMITPFYMMIFLPVMFLQDPGLPFSMRLAFVPVVNVNMMVRSAVSGSFPWRQILITTVISFAVIAVCLWVAAYIMQFEDFIAGSYRGSAVKFLKERFVVKTARRAKEISQ